MAKPPPVASALTRDASFDARCVAAHELALQQAALAGQERLDAELAALEAARAVVEAARKRQAEQEREERLQQARAQAERSKDEYAIVELGVSNLADVEPMRPAWFDALSTYSEKLVAIKTNKLGDWEAFNEWLKKEYDAEELAEFHFEDDEDLEIWEKFSAIQHAEKQKAARQKQQVGVSAVKMKETWLDGAGWTPRGLEQAPENAPGSDPKRSSGAKIITPRDPKISCNTDTIHI